MPTVMWFRRDLRVSDNPALAQAAKDDAVLGVFVLDPALARPAGDVRLAMLYRTLRALNDQLSGRLVVRHGKPASVLAQLCRQIHADRVHCAHDFGPYGSVRDDAVEVALQDIGAQLVRTGSPYAVEPGTVTNGSGGPYQVFTPFYRAWLDRGWEAPHPKPAVRWLQANSDSIPQDPSLPGGLTLPDVGEDAALKRWTTFMAKGIDNYADQRDRPDLDSTSRMSVHLKWGTIHPRTLLRALNERPQRPGHGDSDGHGDGDSGRLDRSGREVYRKELAWREFYADVLYRRPDSAREYYHPRLKGLPYCSGKPATDRFAAWAAGQTGYPIVDAGMRQLRAEGWMHNRVRMIVASFLIKDLRLEWTLGARHFMQYLADGDLASNNHGWQWVAGSGTDAAPYFRIFNPTLQGKKFDPHGDYVRRWVPELNHLGARVIHEPWSDPNGAPAGYPEPIVDHAVERDAALADYKALG
ncbi:cryptochrome/photolyase family protein [Jatrophihabitans sp. DSM 45814]